MAENKSWDFFPNSRGASRSLFPSDVFLCFNSFHLVPVWRSVLAVTAERVCSDLSRVFRCLHTVMNGCMLTVQSWPNTATPAPASTTQTLHSSTTPHPPAAQTGRPGMRSDWDLVDRGYSLSVAGFPRRQFDITLTAELKTNHSGDSVQRLQSEQEPGLSVSRVSPQDNLAARLIWWPLLANILRTCRKM